MNTGLRVMVFQKYLQNCGGLEVIMTGHDISERMLGMADYATQMNKVKHPFDEGKIPREGIEY